MTEPSACSEHELIKRLVQVLEQVKDLNAEDRKRVLSAAAVLVGRSATPAVEAQTVWAHSLLDKTAPPYIRHIPHVGEGHTTLVYQHCKLVGVSIIVRDDFNRTTLTSFDLRRAALAGKGKGK